MVNIKIYFALRILIVLILLGLDIGIYLYGKNLNPDDCVLDFKSQRAAEAWGGHTEMRNISIKLNDLYQGLKDDRCPIIWSKTEGYIYLP